jgi:hypothetical protein
MMANKVLGYSEFRVFCDCIGRGLTFQDFQDDYLSKYQSTDHGGLGGEEGLTLNGFKDFFLAELVNLTKQTNKQAEAEAVIFQWLE